MIKIISVVGARPQFIKMATISRQLEKYSNVQHMVIHTGQHYDTEMSDIFFSEMQIPEPDFNLNVNNLNHGAMTGRMLEEIEKICLVEKPSIVLVYGDTNSTLAGALSAKKLQITLAHIESGLRSYNMQMPEEINRILTDRISDILYCPSKKAIKNLEEEGFANYSCEVVFSGDVMFDSVLFYSKLSKDKTNLSEILPANTKDFILCTIHRQENTDDLEKLSSIVAAINEISREKQIILPMHPRTKKIVEQNGLKINAKITNPLSYFEVLELLKQCEFVMTDSGGLQKEAYFFNKFCITLREETEWTELTDLGVNVLTGSDARKIRDACSILSGKRSFSAENIYGNGHAAEKIVEHLVAQA